MKRGSLKLLRHQLLISSTFYEHLFPRYSFAKKFQSLFVIREKLLYEKGVRKMMIKLTPCDVA